MQYSSRFLELNIPDSFLNINKIPDATKFITVTYICLTATLFCIRRSLYNKLVLEDPNLDYNLISSPLLQMVPSQIWRYPTSLVLSNFIDTKAWKVVVNLLNLIIGGSFIERNWNSSKEMFKFIIVLGSLTNVLIIMLTLLVSFFSNKVRLDIPLDGNYTILIGFPIIYRQLLPETTIIHLKTPQFLAKNFRFKLLPIFVMFTMTVTQIIWFHHFAQLFSIWVTFFASWSYLRFFQKLAPLNCPSLPTTNSQGGQEILVGDASDTFQLIYFFPDLIKPILRPIFNFIYNVVVVKFKVIKPFHDIDIDIGNTIAESRGAKKIMTVEERRRQLALQVLEERMVNP
ncbi:hypothetical protein SCAW_040860 [Saccharomyces cerevisiae]|nr:hypothetical protein H812_YJM1401O00053 [Saccharomyces cerevisiae YJM1401]CAI5319726.1 CMF_HP2_G0043540.mRNA.1.CDS.1 [Saccharomyces cerevisiae]CAI6718837.1 CMF_HP2_G0043540.mRNA.1.CDS.1 [Saccharomyces cerevisiae]CAI6774731.1 CMF_HP1_G0049620.mRNA.1.CDS.1 [Saccharomyces cerevisiae]CAI7456352.1 CMF_collapsed_G0048770.mRNA.1.CDS.1 [Saccharomyces cerevisiae]